MNMLSCWPSLACVMLSILGTLLVASPLPAVAQSQPNVPDPADCKLPSLSEDEVRALVPTPVPTPDVFFLPTALPTGEPVDEATAGAVRGALNNFYACAHAGGPIETIALFSPRFLSLPDGGRIDLDFSRTITPVPEAERVEIVAVWNIQRLADGRVAATVILGPTHEGDQPRTLIFIVAQDRGRWLIDELVTAIDRGGGRVTVEEAVGSPPAATPAQ